VHRCRGSAISIRCVTSARAVRTHLEAWAFALGLRGGIFTTSILALDSTASNASVNYPAERSSVSGVTNRLIRSGPRSSPARAASTARSAQSSLGLGFCRRSTCRVVAVEDRIHQAAAGAHDGHGAVLQRDQLAQPARLEQAGHHQQVGAGVDQVCQAFLEPDFQVTVGVVVQLVLEVPEAGVDGRVRGRGRAQQDQLRALGQGCRRWRAR
jgi:hypothetical protein